MDTSSLLKLLVSEPESRAVEENVEAEPEVIITALSELEVAVQLRAMLLGGSLSRRQQNQLNSRLQSMRGESPFRFEQAPGSIFSTALRQHYTAENVHCRAFDRLHLAAMEELAINRLMTNDSVQAAAARALGYQVIVPK